MKEILGEKEEDFSVWLEGGGNKKPFSLSGESEIGSRKEIVAVV